MPTKQFFDLKDEKQVNIINIAISEFAQYGYVNSSTNRIVKRCGISKGSLFKYFTSKEELYFFILDIVVAEYIDSLEKESVKLPTDLFERIKDYSVMEFSWYIQHTEKATLIINAFSQNDGEIYYKTIQRYGVKELDIYYKLLENTDFSKLSSDKKTVADILKWFLKGFNEDFANRFKDNNCEFEYLREIYIKELSRYVEILKGGLL